MHGSTMTRPTPPQGAALALRPCLITSLITSLRTSLFGALLLGVMLGTAPQARAQSLGQAQGTLSVNGKAYALTQAAAFVDGGDARKPTVLVLSDRPLPPKALVSSASLSLERNINGFSGMALWLDAQRQIFRAEYYEKGEPTATSGLFEVSVSGSLPQALSGRVISTPAAARLKHPVAAELSFSVKP